MLTFDSMCYKPLGSVLGLGSEIKKICITMTRGFNVMSHFFFVADIRTYKLVCLALAVYSNVDSKAGALPVFSCPS